MHLKVLAPVLVFAAGGLLMAATAVARPTSNARQNMPAGSASSAVAASSSVTFQSSKGETVTIKSAQSAPQDSGTPPSFASLDTNHDGSISTEEAAAYPPLANDFEQADRNRNGKVSESEYKHWVDQP